MIRGTLDFLFCLLEHSLKAAKINYKEPLVQGSTLLSSHQQILVEYFYLLMIKNNWKQPEIKHELFIELLIKFLLS
jgi:hypothetical protein